MLSIHENGKSFLQDGQPFFYLADTVWSAFTNIAEDDWEYYLDYRRQQGFTVLQINILPQWDRSKGQAHLHPYLPTESGYDFSSCNTAYFQHAERMVKLATEKGFVVSLVLLWCSYIPGTWADQLRRTALIPKDEVEAYVTTVDRYFSKYHPIYMVSGDTDFESDSIVDYYEIALNKIKTLAPQSLTTLHIRGRLDVIPSRLEANPHLDFWCYQSGHNAQFQATAYTLAQCFSAKMPRKPVINSEPCYEMISYSRQQYGRFTRFDVRRAAWQSILSGAGAGVSYGAHGIWNWHEKNLSYGVALGEGFLSPYVWRDALHFPGAWDYAFIKRFIVQHGLFDLSPFEGLIAASPEIRAARQKNTLLIYVPFNIELSLTSDMNIACVSVIELESQRTLSLDFTLSDNRLSLPMHTFQGDCLYVISGS
ncbi:DUF4038 domain-containing protein [Samsonia erythrinae]|uniref:Uncharacterized protein DUF4038 n=1 Tax=Samsonia erythrinae TaxID=160434 RepID=A0A4R3VVP4_9GAMM|nr:DUF4038 domain-containing protein [Samsonia erythrinae]TCV08773.1 uncharacterized protein DUF4038 [Samsonia erythrinae]